MEAFWLEEYILTVDSQPHRYLVRLRGTNAGIAVVNFPSLSLRREKMPGRPRLACTGLGR